MTGPFFDTGTALKLVVEEPLSPAVREFVAERRVPVPYSRLIEVEMENALQALCFRGEISGRQLAAAKDLIGDLVREGRFRRVDLSLDRIAEETYTLAGEVTLKTGCRTLDLMHVATAKLLGSSEFVSTDRRQLKAADLCGLRTVSIAPPPL